MSRSLARKAHKGSLTGAILLIAGSCIGAGMLALPIVTGIAGFYPSALMFVLCWLFMTSTGLLLLEVNLWYGTSINIVSLSQRTLGPIGKVLSWGLFLFLFYSINVAYVSATSALFADFFRGTFGIELPRTVGSALCVLIFGGIVYLGTHAVDKCNRLLMAGLIAAYALLISLGSSHVQSSYLVYTDWKYSLLGIPVMIISFGFHNMIPSITSYLNGDAKQLRIAFIAGSAIPLVVYVLWQLVILGIVPVQGGNGFIQALQDDSFATETLQMVVGSAWVGSVAQYFAFFAITTSFLGQSLSLVDFIADGLKGKLKKESPLGRLALCALALLPSLAITLSYPHIFLIALGYAGAFGAVILFGLMPALMVWKGRYKMGFTHQQIMPGGRLTLSLVMCFAIAVILLQLGKTTGMSYFQSPAPKVISNLVFNGVEGVEKW